MFSLGQFSEAEKTLNAYGRAACSIFTVLLVLAAQSLLPVTVRLRREVSNSPRFPFCPNAVRLNNRVKIRAETLEVDPYEKD